MKKTILFVVIPICAVCTSAFLHHHGKRGKEFTSTILTGWMDFHCRIVRSAKDIPHVAYSRHFSYTAIAVYESIVGSDETHRSLAGQLKDLHKLPSAATTDIYWPASLNAAYAAMLRQFYSAFGSCKTRIDSMERSQRLVFLNSGVKERLIDKSAEYGKKVAANIIQWSLADAYHAAKPYAQPTGEGFWRPTPPAFASAAEPYWSEKRSFTPNLFSVLNLKPPLYSSDASSEFYKMAKEVYTVSQNLTANEKAIALYWDDAPDGKYMTVFGHWTSILSGLIKRKELRLINAAEAFARMTIAMHEASILAWKGKYQYQVVRPISYIQQHFDKQWSPVIVTPNHPEFPAAHATLSNAAAMTLCTLFGESCAVTDNSYTDMGMNERKFVSLQEVAKEAGISRLYGGIHYRYSIEQGFVLGEAVAKHVSAVISFESPGTRKQKSAP